MTPGQIAQVVVLVGAGGVLAIMSCLAVSSGVEPNLTWVTGLLSALALVLAVMACGRRRR